MPERLPMRPVTNFSKARPARRAFACLGGFLDSLLPTFNKLQERLATIAQPLALLQLIEQRHDLTRQLKQNFFTTRSPKALTIDASFFSRG